MRAHSAAQARISGDRAVEPARQVPCRAGEGNRRIEGLSGAAGLLQRLQVTGQAREEILGASILTCAWRLHVQCFVVEAGLIGGTFETEAGAGFGGAGGSKVSLPSSA
jgi:hypothetical protein